MIVKRYRDTNLFAIPNFIIIQLEEEADYRGEVGFGFYCCWFWKKERETEISFTAEVNRSFAAFAVSSLEALRKIPILC